MQFLSVSKWGITNSTLEGNTNLLSGLKNVEKIDLSENLVDWKTFLGENRTVGKLTSLTYRNGNIDAKSVEDFVAMFCRLQEIDLHGCTFEDNTIDRFSKYYLKQFPNV